MPKGKGTYSKAGRPSKRRKEMAKKSMKMRTKKGKK